MNYLGHIYFSFDDLDMMYANLNGEYIKGSNYSNLPPKIRKGIQLHRFIDTVIDTYPPVLALKQDLYADLPKVSGLAIDLFFDHLLAKHWKRYHTSPFFEYLDTFYQYKPVWESDFHPDFVTHVARMREVKWMNYYPRTEGLEKSCLGVSSKLSFPNKLADAPEVFYKKEQQIQTCFEQYMSDSELRIYNFYLQLIETI